VSHLVLQRVVVRLLFDPDFVERVYADPDGALEGLDLTPDERRMAVAPDRRAYGTDANRRNRTLTELVREFPASSALVLHGAREASGEGTSRTRRGTRMGASRTPRDSGIQILERFFGSPIFHSVIQERGSLAAGYAAFLEHGVASGAIRDPRVGALARLEGAVAQIRRAPPGGLEGSAAGAEGASQPTALPEAPLNRHLVLNPKAALVTVPAGTFDLLAAITRAMAADRRDPVAQVLEPRAALLRMLAPRAGRLSFRIRGAAPTSDPAAGGMAIEHLLVEAPPALDAGADARVSPVTAELAGLLRAAAPPGAEPHTLMATAQALGAETGEEEALILDLVRQGLLIPADR